jgi:hypothetical protein
MIAVYLTVAFWAIVCAVWQATGVMIDVAELVSHPSGFAVFCVALSVGTALCCFGVAWWAVAKIRDD